MDEETKQKREPNPYATASISSIIMFLYTLPIFMKGRRGEFTENDVYETLSRDKSNILGDRAEKLWLQELKKCNETKEVPNFRNVLMKLYSLKMYIVGIAYAFNDLILRPAQIIILGYIIAYYLDKTEKPKAIPYVYVAGLLLSTLLSVLSFQLVLMEAFHTGMDVRIMASNLIYRKSLKLSQSTCRDTTPGQIVNLLSNDVAIFDRFFAIYQLVYIGPAQVIVFTFLLYTEIGPSAFVGIIILALFIPVQGLLGKLAAKYRLKVAMRTDARIQLMNEIIHGIEIIKMYAWEKSFARLIRFHRKMEIKSVTMASYIKGSYLTYFIFISVPLFLTILTHVLLGKLIDARKFFYATAVYNLLGFTMGTIFPQSIAMIKEAGVSFKRIEKFLLLDEAEPKTCNRGNGSIKMTNVTSRWSTSTENTLTTLNLSIKPGSLVAIIGTVGSGDLVINGSISYCSQDPWIFNSTIYQNILFGKEINKEKYEKVVSVCALTTDLEMFSNGDKMYTGEQGSSLSGGQKARINLARAVYYEADIYLLDDPLSAVDVNVGKQIFEHCICGYLKNKTVILVTHQLQYLHQVDRIIVLENGNIKADGTFTELQNSKLNFVKLLKTESDDNKNLKEESKLVKYKVCTKSKKNRTKVVAEQRSTGTVTFSIYKDYFIASGSCALVLVVILLFILSQLVLSGSSYFMTYWVNLEQTLSQNSSHYNDTCKVENNEWRTNFIYIYTGITITLFVLTVLRNTLSVNVCMKSSIHLHDTMFDSVARASMKFFNSNSTGRILNRFTKDIGTVDELLPTTVIITMQTMFSISGIIIVTCIVSPWLLIPSALILIVLNYIKSFYLSASINIKRLEGVTRSPIFGHLHGTLQGITTIRAHGAEECLKQEFDQKQDIHSSTYLSYTSITRALAFWLDCISFIYLFCITLVLVFTGEPYGGNVGLAITQAMQLLLQLQWGIRQLTDMENYMTSVERILEYNSIDHERPLTNLKIPAATWPQYGRITFEKVFLSYTVENPILKNLNFTILPQEKVGIVGRTGAGKSSIISAIFQLFDIEGLNYEIAKGGSNLSVGQRQLICLARAIIRDNKILILDEATANVDPQTDAVIQETIRQKFSRCTVLTVAHRLHTIIDSDRILVINSGELVEFDHPYILLQNQFSTFFNMVQQIDKTMTTQLIQICKRRYEEFHTKP
ncbi:hypothetical protein FQA39_LY08818 [Lamprigera yunnana]|nr:hypothetical protein FQA39_LY08818 [Lamprigera yunnana]